MGWNLTYRQRRSVDADLLRFGPHRELTSQQRFHVAPSETHPERSEDRFHSGMKIPPIILPKPKKRHHTTENANSQESPLPCFLRHGRWVCAHLEGRNYARPGARAQQCQANEPGPHQVTQVFRPCQGLRGGEEHPQIGLVRSQISPAPTRQGHTSCRDTW